jgi:hypothetical protein
LVWQFAVFRYKFAGVHCKFLQIYTGFTSWAPSLKVEAINVNIFKNFGELVTNPWFKRIISQSNLFVRMSL